MKAAATILVALFIATPAAAQDLPDLDLNPGESVTVHFDDGGRVGQPERGTAAWSPLDLAAAHQLSGITPPDAPVNYTIPVNSPNGVQAEPIPGDVIRFRMYSIAGRHSMLVIENGQRRALAYRARITARGQTAPTDVCVVMPERRGYEHWPYVIDHIELTGFRFIPWAPGRAPTCE